MNLTIWVVCYNAVFLLDRCLRQLVKTAPGIPIWVWDNDSGRDTKAFLRDFARTCRSNPVEIFEHAQNEGCIVPRNRFFEMTTTDLFASIDSDLFMEGHWVAAMSEKFRQNPRLGLCGMKGFPTQLDHEGVGHVGPRVDYVGGGACMGKMDVLKKIAPPLFRADLFEMAYCEDADLGFRAKRAGIEIDVADVQATHVGRGTWREMEGPLEGKCRRANQRTLKRLWWPELRALNHVDH